MKFLCYEKMSQFILEKRREQLGDPNAEMTPVLRLGVRASPHKLPAPLPRLPRSRRLCWSRSQAPSPPATPRPAPHSIPPSLLSQKPTSGWRRRRHLCHVLHLPTGHGPRPPHGPVGERPLPRHRARDGDHHPGGGPARPLQGVASLGHWGGPVRWAQLCGLRDAQGEGRARARRPPISRSHVITVAAESVARRSSLWRWD